MKIGFFSIGIGPTANGDDIALVAANADRLGFSTVWSSEHIVLFDRFASQYPYARGEDIPVALDVPFLNPFLALTYAAAHTRRIRLATGVCLAPEYPPLLLAKLAASLDHLSRGRLALGIGIGWLKEEFDALGVPWDRRAARTRECVDAMRTVWSEPRACHRGEFFAFEHVISEPKPSRGRQLPIWVGGNSDGALMRAAEYADGWCGLNLTAEESSQAITRIHALRRQSGRQDRPFECLVSPVATATPADLPRYRDAGVDELYLTPLFGRSGLRPGDTIGMLERLAQDWIEPAGRL